MLEHEFQDIQYRAAQEYLTKKREDIVIDLGHLSRLNRLREFLKQSYYRRWA